jgi:SAM-dependent methyltransferase
MIVTPRQFVSVLALTALLSASAPAAAQEPAAPAASQTYEPRVGQPGKDVVWVPTPPSLVELMLDMAKVTKDDFVMDLGSGDGRTVITAAKRGARALGVEYNPEMVELSKRNAEKEGVSARANFVKADLFQTDFSQATVITMFLLPDINLKLRPKILQLKPGTRVVSNTFGFNNWDPDARESVRDGSCSSWCESLLWIVPASAAGTWMIDGGTLKLTQTHQIVYGALSTVAGDEPISKARMTGYDITFTIGDRTYTGRLQGDTMEGTVSGPDGSRPWKAVRQRGER